MKVYVVTYYDYNEQDSWQVEGVFNTEEKAKAYIKEESMERGLSKELTYQEFEMDEEIDFKRVC